MVYVYKNNSAQKWLHYVRHEEMKKVFEYFPKSKNLKVLEIGGGDGFIASLIAAEGYQIISVDIEPRFPQYYDVKKITNSELPFPDASFDIIFSSNVLEHVKNLDEHFSELKRVSKKDVTMIHTMPTPAWRIASSFWHYLLLGVTLIKILVNKVRKQRRRLQIGNNENVEENSTKVINKSYISKFSHLLLDPHGEYPSAFHEIWYFSKFRWIMVFEKNGYYIKTICRAPIMYAARDLFKFKFIKVRKFLAKYLISGVNIYVVTRS